MRDSDGLALSSRNVRLSPAERRSATTLFRALQAADRLIAGGNTDPASVTYAAAAEFSKDPPLRLEYLEIVDPVDMQPVERIARPVRVAAALWGRQDSTDRQCVKRPR